MCMQTDEERTLRDEVRNFLARNAPARSDDLAPAIDEICRLRSGVTIYGVGVPMAPCACAGGNEAKVLVITHHHDRECALSAAAAALPTLRDLARDAEATEGSAMLSGRELEVLTLAARGAANRRIAARLGITERTVKVHLQHVYAKLGARNRAHAVAIALHQRLIDDGGEPDSSAA